MADCESCANFFKSPICSTCENGSDFKEVVMTNADKIRAMNDEELANTLVQDIPCKICEYWSKEISSCNAPFGFLCTKGYAEALYLKWLQSEAE